MFLKGRAWLRKGKGQGATFGEENSNAVIFEGAYENQNHSLKLPFLHNTEEPHARGYHARAPTTIGGSSREREDVIWVKVHNSKMAPEESNSNSSNSISSSSTTPIAKGNTLGKLPPKVIALLYSLLPTPSLLALRCCSKVSREKSRHV